MVGETTLRCDGELSLVVRESPFMVRESPIVMREFRTMVWESPIMMRESPTACIVMGESEWWRWCGTPVHLVS